MISLIAAVADNRVIGNNGTLPWRIPEDFQRFKEMTRGNPIIMGSKTFLSLPKRPLPERKNVVVTKHPEALMEYQRQGVVLANDPSSALALANLHGNKIYVIGGQQIYEATIDLADRLDITQVRGSYQGDTFFPPIKKEIWVETERVDKGAYSFVTYLRR